MSMLSAQVDELRAMAESVGLAMPQAATLMMEAADTILSLRGALQVASVDYRHLQAERDKLREQGERLFDKTLELGTENAKLRERITTQKQTIQAYRDESREWREVAERAQAENAKLRELLGGVGHLLFILDVDYCVACPRDSISHPCPVYTVKGGECLYKSDMRELGVEVDG